MESMGRMMDKQKNSKMTTTTALMKRSLTFFGIVSSRSPLHGQPAQLRHPMRQGG